MFNSIEDIKRAHKRAGYHFFDESSMALFDPIVYPEVVQHPEGAYFVSSEKCHDDDSRLFTVRFARFTGEVNTVGPFRGFAGLDAARNWAMAHRDGWNSRQEAPEGV